MIEIEKGIEIPKRNEGRAKYPFSQMEVGDSFSLSFKSGTNLDSKRSGLYAAANKWATRNNSDWEFSTRVIEGKRVRIWRTK